MSNRILVPLDGSPLSERVFPWLRFLATKLEPQAEVKLLRTFEPPSTVYLLPELSIPTTNALSDEYLGGLILEYLQACTEKLEGLKVHSEMTIGEPALEILAHSEEADMVLMASHGRGGLGRWLMGSVANKVIRGATVPIMVVGGKVLDSDAHPRGVIERIVVPVDGSEAAERAFATACDLARQLGAQLDLYCGVSQVEIQHQLTLETNRSGVVHFQNYLANLAESVEDLQIECTVAETYGNTGIVEFAEKLQADLVVMGSHGKGGLQRWLVGSETEKTLQAASCPVLVTH
jgi:nucleotide-binding universal stress UspA family protein